MAISERKTNQYSKKKPATRFDRDLMDALNAGRRGSKMNFTYRQGKSIIPVIEPLIIEKKPAKTKAKITSKQKEKGDKLTFEEVSERTRDYAKEHMDPELAKEQKEKAKKLTTRKFVTMLISNVGIYAILSGISVILTNIHINDILTTKRLNICAAITPKRLPVDGFFLKVQYIVSR